MNSLKTFSDDSGAVESPEDLKISPDKLQEMLLRYSSQLPRYTSYPTAIELVSSSDLGPLDGWGSATPENVALYVHLPFCPQLCYFCACNKIITRDRSQIGHYLGLVEQELRLLAAHVGRCIMISDIHLGGGSPSFLSPDELSQLEESIGRHLNIRPDCLKSVEIDPRNCTREFSDRLAELGYSRASLGVQDFNPDVQRAVNRIQSYELTAKCFEDLRQSGISSINVDLIYGLPRQNIESFSETIKQVIDLAPSRVAVYGYAHVPWRSKTQRTFAEAEVPCPEQRVQLFAAAHRLFSQHGYEFIGLDHFAKPGDELFISAKSGTLKRNFMGYTSQSSVKVLGIGVSSISDNRDYLYQNSSSIKDYEESLCQLRLPLARSLKRSADDQAREKIIQDIMCFGEASLETLAEDAIELIKPAFESLAKDGLIVEHGSKIEVTKRGRLFLRNIAVVFDVYRNGKMASRTFSQAL